VDLHLDFANLPLANFSIPIAKDIHSYDFIAEVMARKLVTRVIGCNSSVSGTPGTNRISQDGHTHICCRQALAIPSFASPCTSTRGPPSRLWGQGRPIESKRAVSERTINVPPASSACPLRYSDNGSSISF
jgi:hypothetical protein